MITAYRAIDRRLHTRTADDDAYDREFKVEPNPDGASMFDGISIGGMLYTIDLLPSGWAVQRMTETNKVFHELGTHDPDAAVAILNLLYDTK